jgi:hypothetical protein
MKSPRRQPYLWLETLYSAVASNEAEIGQVSKEMDPEKLLILVERLCNRNFVLVGRQRSFAGIGRFDVAFEDEFKTTIVTELKAKTLKYEDAEHCSETEVRTAGSPPTGN